MTGVAVHVGLDVGSTETKAVAHDEAGAALAELAAPTPWSRLAGGRTQTTGEVLAGAAAGVVAGLVAVLRERHAAVAVRSIGVAGLAESGVLLGPDGAELAPVIAWHDLRGAEEVAALPAPVREAFAARTGLPLHAQASIAKLAWLRAQGLRVPPGSVWLSVPEHVVHALGGERVAEPSLASRTGLLDQATGSAWPEAADAVGLPTGALPPLRTAGTRAGIAHHPGLPPEAAGAVLTVAGHDHPVACVGAGATGEGELFNGCGTADTLARSVPGVLPDAARGALVAAGFSAGRHVLPGATLVLSGVRAGLVLRRVLAALGASTPEQRAALDALAAARPGPVPGVAVTGGSGGRADADEVTVVLGDGASPAAVLAAAVHHLGEETAALLDALTAVVGPHHRAVASGGWLAMRSVVAAKQRVVPRLVVSPVTRAGCRGAALLGALAAADGAGTSSGTPSGTDPLTALVRAWDARDPTGTPASHPAPAPTPRGARP